ERAQLLDTDDLLILSYSEAGGLPWEQVIPEVITQCQARGIGLLVVDTLPQFAGLRNDDENKSGVAWQIMAPLKLAAAKGLAVWVTRHEGKGDHPSGKSGMGSTAWTAAVDITLSLRQV